MAEQEQKDKKNTAQNSGDLSVAISIAVSAGMTLFLSIGLGGVIGYWLDRWLLTAPWLLVIGCLVGGAGGMYAIYRRAIGQ